MDVKKTTNLIILFLIIMFTFVGILTNANNDNKTITETVTTEAPETIKPMITTEEEKDFLTNYLQDSWTDLENSIISFSDDGIIDDREKEKLMDYMEEMNAAVLGAYEDSNCLYRDYEELAYRFEYYEENPGEFLRDQENGYGDYEPLFGY